MASDYQKSQQLHLVMVLGFCSVILLSFLAAWLTSIRVHGIGKTLFVFLLLFAIFAPVPAYWHHKGSLARRDASLAIPFALLTWFFVPLPFLAAARLQLPLRDDLLARMDHAMGISGAAIVSWVADHHLTHLSDLSYNALYPYLVLAILVPALLGKPECERFILANLLCMAFGLACFTLFPAIGPWYSEHFAVGPPQYADQAQVFALRQAQTYSFSLLFDGAGIVAFPSFHVVWAILAASGLWGFRFLRIPLAILSAMIVASTLTTGFHYFTDVLAGFAVVALGLWAAQAIIARCSVQESAPLPMAAHPAHAAVES